MRPPREIEVKLELDPSEAPALKARMMPTLGAAGPSKHLVSVYFDTQKRALRKKGISFRIRAVGDLHIQTVKTSAPAGGLYQRSEWEVDIDGETPELGAMAKTPVHAVLRATRGALAPVFETVIDRTIWTVETKRSAIEVALDEGHIIAGASSEPLAELELELKRGQPSDLFKLLRKLDGASSLRTSVLAKSDRGYALLDGRQSGAFKAAPVELTPKISTAEAFQTIMRGCLRHFRLNEHLVVDTRDPEALHQARVAMRRLRSALSLFKPVVSDHALDGLTSKLRAISRELGDARNLDVYLDRARDSDATADVDKAGLSTFLNAIENRRTRAYDQIVASLGGPAFRRFMIDLLAWIESGPWLLDNDPLRRAQRDRPAILFAADVLDVGRRKLRKRGRRLDKLEAPDRHKVRIAAKKLRYAADFFSGLAETKKERTRHADFIQAMADLQANLGDLNDIETAREIETDFSRHQHERGEAGAAAGFAAGHANGVDNARAENLLVAAVQAHRAVAETRRFWDGWSDA